MNANTNDNPYARFEEACAERGLTDRLEAMEFIDSFRWFHRSERDCPRPNGWTNSYRRLGLYGTFATGTTFNMTTVYNWCADHDESPFELLKWLDRAATAMDDWRAACELEAWEARYGYNRTFAA